MTLIESTCEHCSTPFRLDPDFYLSAGLKCPRRCRWCREARRASGEKVSRPREQGRVTAVHRDFYFVRADADGERLFVHQSSVRAADRPLEKGDRVSLERSERPPAKPGQSRHASAVRREDADA